MTITSPSLERMCAVSVALALLATFSGQALAQTSSTPMLSESAFDPFRLAASRRVESDSSSRPTGHSGCCTVAEEEGCCECASDCGCAKGCSGGCGNCGILGFGLLDDELWTISFTQTTDYQTNLYLPFTLTPNNTAFLEDDFQFQTLAGVRYLLAQGDDGSALAVGGAYYQSLHPDVHEIDLMAPSAVLAWSQPIGDTLTFLVDSDYSYYFLDTRSFVDRPRAGARIQWRPGDRWVFQVGYDYYYFNFRLDSSQDASLNSPRFEVLRYLNEDQTTYLALGWAYLRNAARIDSWKYDAYAPFAGVYGSFGQDNLNNFALLASYGDYRFDGFDVIETTTRRYDRVWTLSMRVGRQITDCIGLFAQYVWYDSDSTIARQDYDSDLWSGGATITW